MSAGGKRPIGLRLIPLAVLATAIPVLGATAAGQRLPELPRAFVDTILPATVATCTISVLPGDDAQAAVDRAQLGDTICLAAGGTFTGSAGGPLLLRKKTTGSGWVTIRTSTSDAMLPAPGFRVKPADTPKLARVVSTGLNYPGIQTETGAHHYRIIGIEVTKISASAFMSEAIVVDGRAGHATSYEELPSYIIFDRMFIHGDGTSDVKRGIRLNCSHCAVIDSTVSDIHSRYQDAQAILGWYGPGPFKIENNYLEASGENIMFGGADPTIKWTPTVAAGATVDRATLSSVEGFTEGSEIVFAVGGRTGDIGLTTIRSINGNTITYDPLSAPPDADSPAYWGAIPSDIEIRSNYFAKPRFWNPKDPSYAGIPWAVKNLFETKAEQRVLVAGNIFDGSWVSGQAGFGIVLKSTNQDGSCPWCQGRDITFINNIVKNVRVGLVVSPSEEGTWNEAKMPPGVRRVLVRNNLFYNDPDWSNGPISILFAMNGHGPSQDIQIDHNTGFGNYNMLFPDYLSATSIHARFTFTNNIIERGAYEPARAVMRVTIVSMFGSHRTITTRMC